MIQYHDMIPQSHLSSLIINYSNMLAFLHASMHVVHDTSYDTPIVSSLNKNESVQGAFGGCCWANS
jgi:hypothetical protein